jgi:hypothetical protein
MYVLGIFKFLLEVVFDWPFYYLVFQIWEVVFEPDPQNADKTTSKVATCGGNSICIIDVTSGTVMMKYKHKELK